MKTIKIIDLFLKKANGEELPSEINCYNQTFYLSDGIYIAKNQAGKYFEDYFDFSSLDYEVEIIENTPKEDNKIKHIGKIYDITKFKNDYPEVAKLLNDIANKQYEIIDYINKEKQ